mmetsp:Transcript_3317/g.4996  ORF Transcript_3317/g.4996 Transcript_3317/m.4996 type:complete len:124 (+) Transcript_3317:72-443(+)
MITNILMKLSAGETNNSQLDVERNDMAAVEETVISEFARIMGMLRKCFAPVDLTGTPTVPRFIFYVIVVVEVLFLLSFGDKWNIAKGTLEWTFVQTNFIGGVQIIKSITAVVRAWLQPKRTKK